MCRHNAFFYPYVSFIMESIRRDISADYYGIINSDILISDRIFLVMDQIDSMVLRGTLKPIVLQMKFLHC